MLSIVNQYLLRDSKNELRLGRGFREGISYDKQLLFSIYKFVLFSEESSSYRNEVLKRIVDVFPVHSGMSSGVILS